VVQQLGSSCNDGRGGGGEREKICARPWAVCRLVRGGVPGARRDWEENNFLVGFKVAKSTEQRHY
jgi:hypothetical protein